MNAAFASLAMAVVSGLALVPAAARAQTAPPVIATTIPDDMPLADYLGLLTQISPAAHNGARAYLQAFQRRCGRPLRTPELRRAMTDGDGDPVLMGMIRASHLRDATAIAHLGQRLSCDKRSAR